MYLLNDKDNNDIELFIYTMTLINKTLNGIPDQDTYYDVVDALEEQNMELVLKRMVNMANKDLTEQCRLYEGMLKQEDGDETIGNCVNNSLRRFFNLNFLYLTTSKHHRGLPTVNFFHLTNIHINFTKQIIHVSSRIK